MTSKAEFERLLDVYGFRCERFGQDLSTHARAQVVSAFTALASAPVAGEPVAYAIHNIDLKGEVRVYGVMPWTGPDCMLDDAGWGSRWAGNRPLVYGDAAPQASEAVRQEVNVDVDQLANEIRRVDGAHTLGAGALAEALMPFIRAHTALSAQPGAQKKEK